ncbi:MAG: hypothetical protein AAF067_13100 [Pseudomonadota bacterium]
MHRQRVIGGLILLGAILIAALLYLFRSTPEGEAPEELIPLVQVAPIEIRSGNLMVSGSGTVRARDEVTPGRRSGWQAGLCKPKVARRAKRGQGHSPVSDR